MLSKLAIAVLFACPAISLPAAVMSLDFESFADNTAISTEFAGITFSNAVVVTAGLSLNELIFPPRSGFNVALDSLGPIEISFSAPALSLAGYFTYTTGMTLTAFDVLNQVVGVTNSAFSNNTANSLNPSNELLQLSFAGGISRVTLAGGTNGGSFAVDDLAITTPDSTAVPEPGTILLVAAGLALLRRR
ncbi:MAG: PEP-CTERM sorting domain-containing protein [Bryobacterales bacterium]|nr:PEP-CTERM sorting domain-containing protein [Bryobacterales bacterium]